MSTCACGCGQRVTNRSKEKWQGVWFRKGHRVKVHKLKSRTTHSTPLQERVPDQNWAKQLAIKIATRMGLEF